jgi:hypothetical protein
LAGEFVAEVGGKRMRLKPGDSLLMPMKVPHRWSVAQAAHCGAIHPIQPCRPNGDGLGARSSGRRPDEARISQGGVREARIDAPRRAA